MEGKKALVMEKCQVQVGKESDGSSTWILKSLRMDLNWGEGADYRPKSVHSSNQEDRTRSPTVQERSQKGHGCLS